MATLTIRDLDEHVHDGLLKRAAERGRSVEKEASEILAGTVLRSRPVSGLAFTKAIRECMKDSGGLESGELVLPDRPPPDEPIVF